MSESPFLSTEFVDRFVERHDSDDSVNRNVDEPTFLDLLPELKDLQVLEIGSGLGDLLATLRQKGAVCQGMDCSPLMVERAVRRHPELRGLIEVSSIESWKHEEKFDLVVSTLSMHFIRDFEDLTDRVFRFLNSGGLFVFSQRHPVRTCRPEYSSSPEMDDWIIADYFSENPRDYVWLGKETRIFHRTLSSIIQTLLRRGFTLLNILEPTPRQAVSEGRLAECATIPAILTVKCQKPF